MISQTLLIELDTLLDTRYGVLLNRFPVLADNLNIDTYVKRIRNEFWAGVTDEDWQKAYADRNIEDLACAKPTGLYHNIPLILGPKLGIGDLSPVHDELKVVINVWPYILSTYERECIVESVQAQLWKECNISTTSIPLDKLTPTYLKEQFMGFILYDLEAWFTLHHEALLSARMPTFTFYFPAIVTHWDELEHKKMMAKQVDPFSHQQTLLAEYCTLTAIDSDIFSLHQNRHEAQHDTVA